MTSRSILGTAAIALCLVPELHGQDLREIRPGDRVRVMLASRIAPAPLIGTVADVGPDTLVVEREGGGLRRLSRAQVGLIEVSVSREFEGGKAAGYGVLAAAPLLIPLAIFLPILAAESGEGYAWALVVAAVGGSMLVGALIGGTTPQDTWVEARWPDSTLPPGQPDSLEAGPPPFDSHEDR